MTPLSLVKRFLLPSTAAGILAFALSSCIPVDESGRRYENQRQHDMTNLADRGSMMDQNKLRAEAELKEKREKEKIAQEKEKLKERKNLTDQIEDPPDLPKQNKPAENKKDTDLEGFEEKPKPKPTSHPVAAVIPGKPGFVFSPFNNKVVDVKGIPSGTLVWDPHYPQSENKRFRVP